MTRKQMIEIIGGTWKGSQLRAMCKPKTSYRHFRRHTMINARTMFVKLALMKSRHTTEAA